MICRRRLAALVSICRLRRFDIVRREDWCDMMDFARHVALSFMFFREMCGGEVEGAKITP